MLKSSETPRFVDLDSMASDSSIFLNIHDLQRNIRSAKTVNLIRLIVLI